MVSHLLLNLEVYFVACDCIDFVYHLLVAIQVEFGVLKGDDELGVTAVKCLVDGCLDLEVQGLDISIQHLVLVKFFGEFSLTIAIVLGTPLPDFTDSYLFQALLHFSMRGVDALFLAALLGLSNH